MFFFLQELTYHGLLTYILSQINLNPNPTNSNIKFIYFFAKLNGEIWGFFFLCVLVCWFVCAYFGIIVTTLIYGIILFKARCICRLGERLLIFNPVSGLA